MKPNLFDAVLALVGGQITGGNDLSKYIFHDKQKPPSQTQVNTKLKELTDAYDLQNYARLRQAEYPDLESCIHAILDDDLDALQAKRKAVKDKFPKP